MALPEALGGSVVRTRVWRPATRVPLPMAGALLGFWSERGRCYEPQHHRQDFAKSLNKGGVVT